jgi:hypothetical protein
MKRKSRTQVAPGKAFSAFWLPHQNLDATVADEILEETGLDKTGRDYKLLRGVFVNAIEYENDRAAKYGFKPSRYLLLLVAGVVSQLARARTGHAKRKAAPADTNRSRQSLADEKILSKFLDWKKKYAAAMPADRPIEKQAKQFRRNVLKKRRDKDRMSRLIREKKI